MSNKMRTCTIKHTKHSIFTDFLTNYISFVFRWKHSHLWYMFVTNIDMFTTKLKCVIEFEQTLCCRTLDQITISMAMHKEINTLYTNDDRLFVNYSMIAHVCINKLWTMNSIPLFYFYIWLTISELPIRYSRYRHMSIIQ